jgi:hypothetical protein
MTSTVRRLVALADVPLGRALVSLTLGALAVGFGVALMATAGYLISRAAERPEILTLTTIIVTSASWRSRGRWPGTSSGSHLTTSRCVLSAGFARRSTSASSRSPRSSWMRSVAVTS